MADLTSVVLGAKEPTRIITDLTYTADRVILFIRRALERLAIDATVHAGEHPDLFSFGVRRSNRWFIHIGTANSARATEPTSGSTGDILSLYFWPFRALHWRKMPKPLTSAQLLWVPLRESDLQLFLKSQIDTGTQVKEEVA
jgi:hypothetical protein